MTRLMSDAEIRRRKKLQSRTSEATGALGLTALGGTLLASKTGSRATKTAFQAIGRDRPGFLKPKKLRSSVAPVLATSAGIGGASAFNFASYTKAESRKRGPQQPKKPKDPFAKSDPFEVSKISVPKRFAAGMEASSRGRGRSTAAARSYSYASGFEAGEGMKSASRKVYRAKKTAKQAGGALKRLAAPAAAGAVGGYVVKDKDRHY